MSEPTPVHPTSPGDAAPSLHDNHPDVLILGAGIIGLACARELLAAGLKVAVVERQRPGSGATNTAAGMLTPLAEAEGEDSSFYRACRASRERWLTWHQELTEESGLAIEYDDSGMLFVAASDDEAAGLERLKTAARTLGEPVVELPLAEARRRVPGLTDRLCRALLLPTEHRVDNVQATAALARLVQRSGGVLHRQHEVQEVEVGASSVVVKGEGWQFEAASLVITAGAWCGEIPGLPSLPVRPVRGQMLRVSGVPWDFRGTLRSPHHYAVRRGAHDLLVGASVEEAGFDCRTTVGGLAKLFEFVLRYLPRLTDRPVEETWAGLRPGTPDGLPLVGRCGDGPVYAATGHFRNGILLAPWTATAIACLLRGLEPPDELAAFSPDRFAATSDRF